MNDKIVTKDRLVRDFKALGLKKGDLVMMHSSLKNVGWVENGADTVIDVLIDVLGGEGTIVVPTYTYSYAGREGAIPYDSKTTPSYLNGIIADTLWKRPSACRSDHPAYSFAALGGQAEFITGGHPVEHPLGPGSPLYKLAYFGGRVLLLGVGQDRNSLLHVAEIIADVGYMGIPFRESWGRAVKRINGCGCEELVPQSEFPGCSFNFGIVEGIFKLKGMLKYGRVGNAVAQLMEAKDVMDETADILKRHPDFLFCDRDSCECCINRRNYLMTLKK